MTLDVEHFRAGEFDWKVRRDFRAALDALCDPATRTQMGEAAHSAATRLDWSDHITHLRTLFAELAT